MSGEKSPALARVDAFAAHVLARAAPLAFGYPLGTTGASAIGGMNMRVQCDGNFAIPPGVCFSIQMTAAGTVGLCAICWEEVPIVP